MNVFFKKKKQRLKIFFDIFWYVGIFCGAWLWVRPFLLCFVFI